jgi:hypothetical protein
MNRLDRHPIFRFEQIRNRAVDRECSRDLSGPVYFPVAPNLFPVYGNWHLHVPSTWKEDRAAGAGNPPSWLCRRPAVSSGRRTEELLIKLRGSREGGGLHPLGWTAPRHLAPKFGRRNRNWRPSMTEITRIAIDTSKSVVHQFEIAAETVSHEGF